MIQNLDFLVKLTWFAFLQMSKNGIVLRNKFHTEKFLEPKLVDMIGEQI